MEKTDPRWWHERPFQYSEVGNRITAVREDLLDGGSKSRFLPFIAHGAEHIVFGGPFCGGAPYAMSIMGRETGQRVTLFYAKRKELHPRQQAALENGATLYFVKPGYMTVVQARAKKFAADKGALFLPLGFDVPAAEEPYVDAMERVRREKGSPDEIWCATGSGMLARCLGRAFPDSAIHGVAVGLKSRHDAQAMPPNVQLHDCSLRFDQQCKAAAPFPSCPNYDRKAWELCERDSRGSVLFWNVLG